jgi:hypothetical protein
MAAMTAQSESSESLRDAASLLRDLRGYIKKGTVERDRAIADFEEAKSRYEKAEAEFKQTRDRYERLERDLSLLMNQESFWAIKAGEQPESDRLPTAEPIPPGPQTPIPAARRGQVPYADLARFVLAEAGRPLTTKEVVRELVRKGYIPPEQEGEHRSAAYSSMARSRHITRTDGAWDLADRPNDSAAGT